MDHEIIDDEGEKQTVELYMFKILVVGQSSVGKTSFVRRYAEGKFSTNYKATINVDFANKTIKWSDTCQAELFLWDLAGQERIGTQIDSLFRETRGVIFVCDIGRSDKENNIQAWKELVDEKCTLNNQPYKPPSILLVNKCDTIVDTDDSIDSVDITNYNRMAKTHGMIGACAISAKTGEGVDNAMKIFLAQLIKVQRLAMKNNLPDMQDIDKVKLAQYKDSSQSSCC